MILSEPSYSLAVLIVSPADDVGDGGTLEMARREERADGVGGAKDSENSDWGGREDRAEIEIESRGLADPRLGVRREEGELNIGSKEV